MSWILYATVPLLALALWQVRAFAATAFDRDHARAAGRPVARLEAAFAAGFLVLVAVLAPRAGAPFVFTYLTIPPAAAERLVARPTSVALASVLLGALGFLVGALASVRWDLPFSTSAAAGALLVAGVAACVSALLRAQFVRSSPSG